MRSAHIALVLLVGCGDLRQRERPFPLRDGGPEVPRPDSARDTSVDAPPDGAAMIPAPRPIAPMSSSVVPSARPDLRWALAPGVHGAVLELSTNRSFPAGMVRSQEVNGDRAAPSQDLTPGTWFWRLRGRSPEGVGTTPGPVWVFRTQGRMAQGRVSWWSSWDHDGNGRTDLAVGDPTWAQMGSQGAVTVFLNPHLGSFMEQGVVLTAGGGRFGHAVASAGDLDGDGYSELAVGAPDASGGGAVYIYWGNSDLATARPTELRALSSGVTFGSSVAALGDADGNGYGDLAVGAPGQGSTGTVFLFRGGPDRAMLQGTVSELPAPPEARSFGHALAGLGDLNGDGSGELLVSAPALGGVAMGVAAVFEVGRAMMGGMPPPRFFVPGAEQLGFSVAHLGDVDGDGQGDVAIGAPSATGAGAAYFFRGPMFSMTPSRTWNGAPGSRLGYSVTGLGDINGDNVDDVALGAPSADGARGDGTGPGRVVVLLGGGGFFDGAPGGRDATSPMQPPTGSGALGSAVRGVGDINGDRNGDFIVGAPGASQVLLVLGGPSVMSLFATAMFRAPILPPMAMARSWGFSLAGQQ
ncbi:MAG: FG-GAP repeat protein [Deltaproteobacteria bacterium]|nr:FG-GAP repeat protein [Deltaproteobacteria bacterium]